MKLKSIFTLLMILSIGLMPACNSSRKTKGVLIGAGAGAATGAVLSKNNRAAGIIIGAAVGGIAGGLIGSYMDKQAEKIRQDLEGARVERVGEGILVTFDSGILFDVDSYALKTATRNNLDKLATTLNKYPDTEVMVLGHTDHTGPEKYNQDLSERRAASVKHYLAAKSVANERLMIKGYGETDPIATNDTVEGRDLNRRVEIVITASKKLVRDAKKGGLETS